MITAVDTNIISALWSGAPVAEQAFELMSNARRQGQLVICAIVYAELIASPRAGVEFVDGFLDRTRIEVDFQVDRRLCREAGIRFQKHALRRQEARDGTPRRIVADFLIGMHAVLHAHRILTFDWRGYRRDFPELTVIPVAEN